MNSKNFDVVIMGAGMAGLTLARQLQRRRQDLNIAVIEHRRFPMPEAAFKVGESTVEIAAHYLSHELGLQDHLKAEQLPKFGLRLFVRGIEPVVRDLSEYDEIGVSQVLPVDTYQIDRGRLENYLASANKAAGITILEGTTIRKIHIQPGAHRVIVRDGEGEHALQARYLVDTSGRRAWLRQQLNLERPARHGNHAVWCRIPGAIELDDLSSDAAWLTRCPYTSRRFSTNHFTGPGYWLWLIPLASGATSVGLVFDPKFVALEEVNRFDGLVSWIAQSHPLIAAEIAQSTPLDFHTMESYAKSCKQVFDPSGWMISGDAGVFADPFYSPGADFIAFANMFITELICQERPAEDYQHYQNHFMAFFTNTFSLYKGQYGGFGHRDLLVLKTIWDYAYYWGPLAKLFFSQRCTDLNFMAKHKDELFEAAKINSSVQKSFREFAREAPVLGGGGNFFDHHKIEYFHQLKRELLAGDNSNVGTQLSDNIVRLDGISKVVQNQLARAAAGGGLSNLDEISQLGALV